MTAVDAGLPALGDEHARLADTLVVWLETGVRPTDLFAEDVFLDLSVPHWRIQQHDADGAFGVREGDHPHRGRVRVEGLDRTSRGFLLQFEERWAADGQQWYCRELLHCVVDAERITEMYVYCTGDWDAELQLRHTAQVRLLRP